MFVESLMSQISNNSNDTSTTQRITSAVLDQMDSLHGGPHHMPSWGALCPSLWRWRKRSYPAKGPSRAHGSEEPIPPNLRMFSLTGQLHSAQLIRLLLARAGDVESNPGPSCSTCLKALHKSKPFLSCSSCHSLTHKGEICSGLSRTLQAHGSWTCKRCTNTVPTVFPATGSHISNLSRGSHCLACSKVILPSKPHFSCSHCNAYSHKGEICSGLSRTLQALEHWVCRNCSQISSPQSRTQTPVPPSPPRQPTSPHSHNSCSSCHKTIQSGKPHLSCRYCDAVSHKGEKCSGLTITQQTQGIWLCRSCTLSSPPASPNPYMPSSQATPPRLPALSSPGLTVTSPSSTGSSPSQAQSPSPSPVHTLRQNNVILVGQTVGAPRVIKSPSPQHRCIQCYNVVRATRYPLKCGGCDRLCHKNCSELTRSEQLDFRDSDAWRCEACSRRINSTATNPATQTSSTSERKMDLSTRSNITALQWNANGIKGKMMELTVTANKLKLDVIMIQESKLRATDKLPLIPGYSTVRKDRGTDKGGGLITFIKDDLPFTTIDHPTNVPGSLL